MKKHPEKEEIKGGESVNQEKFITLDDKGDPHCLSRAVFPIFHQDDNTVKFLATGFFISNSGIFVTAAHVIRNHFDEKTGLPLDALMVVESLGNNRISYRKITYASFQNNSDICIGVCAGNLDECGKLINNKKLTVGCKKMVIGDNVHTYAYPNHVIIEDTQKTNIYVNPRFYEGKIVEDYPVLRDSTMLPNPSFQTSIHIYGGASGGPVFCDDSGLAIGVNSSSYSHAPDVSFISKLVNLDGFSVPDGGLDKFISIGELIELGSITIE